MLKNIKGAIFDMDGTLIDSLMIWSIVWDKFGRLFCKDGRFAPSLEDDKEIRTMTLRDSMNFIHRQYNLGESGDDLLEKLNKILVDFYSQEVKLKDGVAEFLEYCYNKGMKMCIASATDTKFIKIAVKHCNIEKYFENILSCAEIGKGKDHPDIYIKAQECLGTEREETCVFEDSHIALHTADKLGMKTVGIYDKYNYGQEEMEKIATVYIPEGETLKKLIDSNFI
ncbi:MAG: HAD family phosphatase [Ruminococcaceae bacterium]|nr:HAD family phosphatase [Oscillospiraceae bacterium]